MPGKTNNMSCPTAAPAPLEHAVLASGVAVIAAACVLVTLLVMHLWRGKKTTPHRSAKAPARAAARVVRTPAPQSSPEGMPETANPKERTVRAPVFNEICSETGVTLSRYMMELSRENPELRDLESLIGGIQQVTVCCR